MSEITYEKIISQENIGGITLGLLTNQNSTSARPAGIFTQYDLVNIHKYIHFALSLPDSAHDVLSWLRIDESTTLPIERRTLTETIQLIREHAGTWDNVEQQVKQQSINLSLTSRNITQTGNQILDYINDMPIIKQINTHLEDLSNEELLNISYQNDDQQIATELLSILTLIKEEIQLQANKTTTIKDIISDFRINIIGGYLSNHHQVDSLLFKVKAIYLELDSHNDINTDSELYLREKIDLIKQEIYQLEQEYNHFVKLCFTGLAGGLIGLIITGSIFGDKAENIRYRKNELLKEIIDINTKINKNHFIKKNVLDIQIHLQAIEGYLKDARFAVDHLDYMWLVILTEINHSIDHFSRIDNAANLLKFIIRFKKIITEWDLIQDYSKQLIELFDTQLPPNTNY
ncbi:alpha-xenorhabdolysin family binary toxin subunit A [Providencia burhodogranariea]|uniref:Toxin XaxA n=1 Tax=Providencia burhodogranariea DSM 19968 TaxID=1141662 RepID=K8X632_9GAMM|nr:alpha-xenorhabdolysin family binary toxin subunit A [Providencia burhodogranariea]EKT63885.1 hypothetical protein OOA_03449 [Providencia burhodogranariea DSM 19968]